MPLTVRESTAPPPAFGPVEKVTVMVEDATDIEAAVMSFPAVKLTDPWPG
jgi:hypothetical protein